MFLDFQKAFDTVNHDILLKKLEYYGIRDKSNKWFRSFLENRKQHTIINKARSFDKPISVGVPQGSILGPILFIVFINDFYKAVEFSSVHHFADDTNLLLTENSLKKLNKHINRDLKLVVQWVRANKLNTGKTKIVIFKSRNSKTTKHFNFRISRQEIVPVDSVKYLGLTLQSDFHWKTHLTSLEKKLSRRIGFLSKIRHYVPKFLLKTIYYSIFNSHLIYGWEVLGQNENNVLVQRLQKLQEKAVCLVNFETNPNVVGQLLKDNNILKLTDFI